MKPIHPDCSLMAKEVLETFKAVQQQVPKRVFLARWYPPRMRRMMPLTRPTCVSNSFGKRWTRWKRIMMFHWS